MKYFVVSMILGFLGVSCTTQRVLPTLEITVIPMKFDQNTEPKQQLQALQGLVKDRPEWQKYSADLKLALQAEHHQKLAEWHLASEAWLDIVSNFEGDIAFYAFDQWQIVIAKVLGSEADSETIARFFWKETNGPQSWFARKNKLESPNDMKAFLSKDQDESEEKFADDFQSIKTKDPLYLRSAKLYCKTKSRNEWRAYVKAIPVGLRDYWQALVHVCSDQRQAALDLFSKTLFELRKKKESLPFAVSSARHIVDLERYFGNREAAANGFLVLVTLLKDDRLDAVSMGMDSKYDWHYELINTTLWAARYRAMVGDYLSARAFVQDALKKIEASSEKIGQMTRKQSDSIQELRAEAHHIHGYRISLEQQDFSGAYFQNRQGLALENLSETWQDRFAWFDGWYQYLDGKPKAALKSWKTLLTSTRSKSLKEQVLFWMAKVHRDLGNRSKFSEYFRALEKNYPLGFYGLYGADYYKWEKPTWLDKNEMAMRKELSNWDVDIGPLLRDETLNRLRLRAEIALLIEAKHLAPMTAKELYREARKRLKLKNTEAHLFVTRILYMNNLFPLAMGHTTNVAIAEPKIWHKYPEQVLVYYPAPFEDVFSEGSSRYPLSREFLLAIARQESGFRADATSWAGAKGLLQLMPKTAGKFSKQELSEKELIDRLEDPKFNVHVGSRYLDHLRSYYKGNWVSVIASYNAGEYVVDRWNTKRSFSDDMVWIENIPFTETKNYVKKVMRNWLIYKSLYSATPQNVTSH
ncbi:lytic transglycosylase domain-containing protein [Pseudobacteriovorax antillogorgiicola]|uniref:Soluble lytic murein transglycosylase n=1 Tax=Pseudobacteriovorax antillogorgiicola TaxID=1513793 RepID=A0A1Y6B3E5_9BACT|nr:lytic transglycosylase domain-containing protein [Pseudobacteriovorax antillogorgiicola]TCS59316.1 soluble lytic murein transglycosylase-like protein [Pseudobacteriovorax antillogorgiicola]SME89459.1 Soluble lytic murein transglycosylase [Pseudobacteriovorax antillogorgiicola]